LGGGAFTIIRVLLGLVLLTAAALKLYGLNVTAVPRVGWFASPRVQVVAAEWELVLGLWLLSGVYQAGAWLAAVGTFLTFAGISGYLGLTGVVTCGCFGVVRASPWHAFGVDVAALVLLAFCRPPLRADSFRPPSGLAAITAGTVAILLVLTGVGSLIYGSPAAALARLRGEVLTVSSDYVDFGSGSAQQVLEAFVEVQNWSDRPVHLIGGTSDCTCVTTSDLPLVIPPGEARHVEIRLTVPRSRPGAFTRTVELWTDHPKQREVQLRVGCRVVE
jgi:hypothetical protein